MGIQFGKNAWTDEQTAVLIELIAAGKSSKEVAEALNAQFCTSHSKNAVIGKCNRLGLSRPDKPQRTPPKPREPRVRIVRVNSNSNAMRVTTSVQTEYKPRCIEIVPIAVALVDLEHEHCRFPYAKGDSGYPEDGDGSTLFCGHPKMDPKASSYCFRHFHNCREESKPRRISLGAAA